MANQHRLISCSFVNESSFKIELTNKAKLLYFYMLSNGDDYGFVGCTLELLKTLQNVQEKNETTIDLVKWTYVDALYELLNKGLLFEFTNNHNNRIYLIRHWFLHNKPYTNGWTNYLKYRKQVKLVDGKYVWKEKEDDETYSEKPMSREELLKLLGED